MFICKHSAVRSTFLNPPAEFPQQAVPRAVCLAAQIKESGALCLRRKRAHCFPLPRKSFWIMQAQDAAIGAICQSGRRWFCSGRLCVDLGPRSDNGQDLFADAGRRGFQRKYCVSRSTGYKISYELGNFCRISTICISGCCAGGFMARSIWCWQKRGDKFSVSLLIDLRLTLKILSVVFSNNFWRFVFSGD